MSEKDEQIVRRYYSDLFSAGRLDLAALDRFVAEGFVAHELPLQRGEIEVYKRYISLYATCFSEIHHMDLRDLFSCEDKVVARWSWRGKHSAEFMGIPASGRQVTVKGIDIFRLRGGEIVDLWQEMDVIGILQQISAPVQDGVR